MLGCDWEKQRIKERIITAIIHSCIHLACEKRINPVKNTAATVMLPFFVTLSYPHAGRLREEYQKFRLLDALPKTMAVYLFRTKQTLAQRQVLNAFCEVFILGGSLALVARHPQGRYIDQVLPVRHYNIS